MLNFEISTNFFGSAILMLTVFLLFFIPFFIKLLFSKKELHLRHLLESGALPTEEIIEGSCKLPREYFYRLYYQMLNYCTKIFESSNGVDKRKWITSINSIAEIKKRTEFYSSLVAMTRDAILGVSPDKLADDYFRHILDVSHPDYRMGSKPKNCAIVEDFILETVLQCGDDRMRQEFITALKQKMDQRLKDDKKIGKAQEVLMEAEILKIKRSFFQR